MSIQPTGPRLWKQQTNSASPKKEVLAMKLAPFGVLHNDYKASLVGLYEPMRDWPPDRKASYRPLLRRWLDDVTENIWPEWQDGNWVGGAASRMEAATEAELKLAVRLYHGGESPDILTETLDIPPKPDGRPTTHEWHYKIEDSLILDVRFLYPTSHDSEAPSFDFLASNSIGSNYLVYDASFDIKQFQQLFWGRMRAIQPAIWDIKEHFQRPRPWTAATALGVDGFRWVVAGGFFVTHTGVHPSLLSGHCIQGILGGCSVYDGLLELGGQPDRARIRAIQKYMVDWGDRRVFAGVHYMTDNIASWTLARRLIPFLFKNRDRVEDFAVQAITAHSRVFADIVEHFATDDPARQMLLTSFPEADLMA